MRSSFRLETSHGLLILFYYVWILFYLLYFYLFKMIIQGGKRGYEEKKTENKRKDIVPYNELNIW